MTNPLSESLRIQLAAEALGFDWRDLDELWGKLDEEIGELKEAAGQGRERAQDELGDLLFMAVNLARHLKLDPVAALEGANAKFSRRFRHILNNLEKLPDLGHPRRIDAMEALWQEAKRAEKPEEKQER